MNIYLTNPYLQNTPPKNPPTSAPPMAIYVEMDTANKSSIWVIANRLAPLALTILHIYMQDN